MDEALESAEGVVLAWVEFLVVVSPLEMPWQWRSPLEMLSPYPSPLETRWQCPSQLQSLSQLQLP
jgi:hypothetical protein